MTTADPHAAPPSPTAPAAAEDAPVLETLLALWRDLPGLLSDRVLLLSLELKRAGKALAVMIGLIVAAEEKPDRLDWRTLAGTFWVALWVGITAALLQAGLAWGWVLLIVLAINLAGIAYALLRAKSLAHLLTLPATVRRLTVAPAMVNDALHPPAEAVPPAPTYEPARDAVTP